MYRFYKAGLCFLIIFLVNSLVLFGQNKKDEYDLLKNLKGIRVKVIKFGKELRGSGVSEKEVQRIIEDTLLTSGLAIINSNYWKKDPSKASLSVQIVLSKSHNLDYYNANIYLHIKQMSIMKRQRNEKDLESTWFRSPSLHINKNKLKEDLYKGIYQIVGNFIFEYQNSSNRVENY